MIYVFDVDNTLTPPREAMRHITRYEDELMELFECLSACLQGH